MLMLWFDDDFSGNSFVVCIRGNFVSLDWSLIFGGIKFLLNLRLSFDQKVGLRLLLKCSARLGFQFVRPLFRILDV